MHDGQERTHATKALKKWTRGKNTHTHCNNADTWGGHTQPQPIYWPTRRTRRAHGIQSTKKAGTRQTHRNKADTRRTNQRGTRGHIGHARQGLEFGHGRMADIWRARLGLHFSIEILLLSCHSPIEIIIFSLFTFRLKSIISLHFPIGITFWPP